MAHAGDVGTEIAPEVADDPELAARLDDLLHRTCHLARPLTGAEQAAFKVDLDGEGHAARKLRQSGRGPPADAGMAGHRGRWGGWPPVRPPAAVR